MFNQKNNIMVSINKNKDKSIFIYIGNIGTYKTKHDYKDSMNIMLFRTVQYLKKTNKHKDKSKKDKKSKAPLNIGQEN